MTKESHLPNIWIHTLFQHAKYDNLFQHANYDNYLVTNAHKVDTLKYIFGLGLLSLIPTVSSSFSNNGL